MHPRSALRATFVQLLTGATDCGPSVFRSRARPFIQQADWQNDLPAINVYCNSEAAEPYNEAPRNYRRTVSMITEIHVAADDLSDDTLDTICEQIEIAISRFEWHKAGIDYALTSTQMLLIETNASVTNAAAMITWEMTYYTDLPDAGKTDLLDDLLRVHNTYRVGTPETDSLQTVNLP